MAARGATSAYRGPGTFCLLAPLLPFASHSPAGCRVACCRMPPPCVTFQHAAASRVQTMATTRRTIAIVDDIVVRCAVAIIVDFVARRAIAIVVDVVVCCVVVVVVVAHCVVMVVAIVVVVVARRAIAVVVDVVVRCTIAIIVLDFVVHCVVWIVIFVVAHRAIIVVVTLCAVAIIVNNGKTPVHRQWQQRHHDEGNNAIVTTAKTPGIKNG
jgi:hypothetical protein